MDLPAFLPDKSWTRRQTEILQILLDGKQHHRSEFYEDLGEPSDYTALRKSIHIIRRRLEGTGYGIVCELRYRKSYYRLVRFINQND